MEAMAVRRQSAIFRRFAGIRSGLVAPSLGTGGMRTLSTGGKHFKALGITRDELLTRLDKLGLHKPSEIQQKAIPAILTGSDAVLCAETGSGKTLGYLLPMLEMLLSSDEDVTVPFDGKPRLAVVVPTQELIHQLHDTLLQVAPSMERLVKVACGKTGPTKSDVFDVLLATPVALKDNVKPYQLEHIRHCVLDEADVLLTGSSSQPLLTHVLPALRNRRNAISTQFVFAAATLPGMGTKSVRSFVNRYFPDAEEISTEGLHKPPPTLHQAFIQADEVDLSAAVELGDEYLAKRDDVQRAQERRWVASESYEASAKAAAALDNKWRQRCLIDALASTSCSDVGSADDRKLLSERLTVTRKNPDRGSFATTLTPEEIDRCNTRSTLVFVSTVDHAIDVVDFLKSGGEMSPGLKVAGLHKKLTPEDREKTFRKFQAGHIKVLVCTDVAARGLDTVNVEHVIQYHVATDASSYLHRIGRTARMGRYGRVTTFVGRDSERLVADIVAANAADEDMEGVFSRKRSLRRQQKKRVQRVEQEAIARLNSSGQEQ